MELQVIDAHGQPTERNLSVPDRAFGRAFNESLVHQVVTAYLAGARSGTKATKNRSAVRGGGAKPWRQKGTGRARAGTIRSPLWRGGGMTFAASPRDHSQKVNKKMYRAAMGAIFSELVRQERLQVIDALVLAKPKTKLMAAKLAELGMDNVLLVTEVPDENLYLAARNLPGVDVLPVAGLNPVSLIRFERVLISTAAAERIGEWLG